MINEKISSSPERKSHREDISEPKTAVEINTIPLPETMRSDKPLSEEDLAKVKKQWQLMHDLSKIDISNDILLRKQLGNTELMKGTLIHGTGLNLDKLASIKEKGIISGEFLGIAEEGETNYCADFFRVPENMSVKDYVTWSCGTEEPGRTKRMESSRLAINNKYSDDLSIIINSHNKDIELLLQKDAYRRGFEEMKSIISGLPYDKNSSKRERLSAILCGVPSNFISGLILPPKIVGDNDKVLKIKEIFGEKVLFFDTEGNEI